VAVGYAVSEIVFMKWKVDARKMEGN